jgi:putative lipoprotein
MRIRHRQFDSCRLNNRESAWAAARLYGVDFRGLGQEPGWLLEMYRGDSIVFLADYGTRRIVAPWEQPAIASGGQTVRYTAHSDSNKLAITITRDSCTDIMSGFRFPATVEVILDGKRYAGCGRDL